jgi:prepilin-type processing-associated H-X9-DG protein
MRFAKRDAASTFAQEKSIALLPLRQYNTCSSALVQALSRRAMNTKRTTWRAFRADRSGFALLELVVTIVVVVDLLILLLPMLASSGESARATKCAFNLQQLGSGALHYVSAHQFFPTGGWGSGWLGDPDRGFGADQPGGWTYNVLPFIGCSDVWSLGKGINPAARREKDQSYMQQITTVVDIFYCPSRRAPALYPFTAKKQRLWCFTASRMKGGVVKCDYAINAGTEANNERGRGPKTYAEGDNPGYEWRDTGDLDGVSFLRSEIEPSAISSGLNQTYLFGEKYMQPDKYELGTDWGDNKAATAGFNNDTSRVGGNGLHLDQVGYQNTKVWGSAHPEGVHFVFCDGSVRTVNYQIDPKMHRAMCDRHNEDKIKQADWDKWVGKDERSADKVMNRP